jgi:hypothetical protein
MIELTLADTARAIRPFLPDLAGPAAADLDRQLAALLAATDAGEDVDEQLAAVLGSLKLAGWTTYFLEHGEPPRSWADNRRIVRGNEYSISYATEQFDQRGEVSRVELDDLAPLADTPSYPRLDAPAEVAPGEVFTVTAGLRPDADGALVSTGPMTCRPTSSCRSPSSSTRSRSCWLTRRARRRSGGHRPIRGPRPSSGSWPWPARTCGPSGAST